MSRVPLSRIASVALVCVPCLVFSEVYEAPLPGDAFATEPAPTVPAPLRPIAGKWSGTLIGAQMQQQHTIVVERLEPKFAWVVWSVGVPRSVMGGGQAVWYRLPGQVRDNSLVLYINGAVATYKLESNDEVSVVSERGGFNMKGSLKREPMPLKPYSPDEPGTYWPPSVAQLQAAESTSPVKATFPESTVIQSAGPDVPAQRAKWLGKWQGWACNQRSCDVKLAVLSVTPTTARIVQLYAADKVAQNPAVRDAVFEGDELQLRAGSLNVFYRMRPSGEVELLRFAPNGTFAWGVMTKVD